MFSRDDADYDYYWELEFERAKNAQMLLLLHKACKIAWDLSNGDTTNYHVKQNVHLILKESGLMKSDNVAGDATKVKK